MKKPLVIFGSGDMAQLAHYYFSNDSNFEVVSFTVNDRYITEDLFCGLPVIAFENIVQKYEPSKFYMFISIGYSKLNELRKEKFLEAKEKGYKLATYVSSHATILNEGEIGENCFIFEDNTIQPFVKLGNNIILWSGNHIGHHTIIHDHCFIASHVVISGRVEIGEQCFIGVNATLRNNIEIGSKCVIGAGVLMLNDAEPDGVYIGKETVRSRVPSWKLRGI